MRILLTGASSFTGAWFAKALVEAGHEVVMPLRGTADSYKEGIRSERVHTLAAFGEVVRGVSFGSAAFLDLARNGTWDLLCHHAARVTDYRSPTFDALAALAENTNAFAEVLRAMGGVRGVVLTGSVFEADEGAGEAPLRAFSPYGLSKTLTSHVVRFWCQRAGVSFGRFVVPNPFGPLEEPRFTAYLAGSFLRGETPEVRTPAYVRDNIHVDLLAGCYAKFCDTVGCGGTELKATPSGYVESQGAFARRFAREMSTRLGRECHVVLREQEEFTEPLMRVNTEPATLTVKTWDERSAWDSVADFYSGARQR